MDVKQVVAQVKKETGIKLDELDPVLAVAAINDVLLDDALAKMDHSIQMAVSRFESAARRSEDAAKTAASQVINSAADWLVLQMKQAAHDASREMLVELYAEVRKAHLARKAAVTAAWASGGAALFLMTVLVGQTAF